MKLSRTKRNILIASASLLIIAAVLVTLLLISGGEDEPSVYRYGDFEYTVLENGRLEITDYLGDAKDVKIPTAIEGRSVYSIG